MKGIIGTSMTTVYLEGSRQRYRSTKKGKCVKCQKRYVEGAWIRPYGRGLAVHDNCKYPKAGVPSNIRPDGSKRQQRQKKDVKQKPPQKAIRNKETVIPIRNMDKHLLELAERQRKINESNPQK